MLDIKLAVEYLVGLDLEKFLAQVLRLTQEKYGLNARGQTGLKHDRKAIENPREKESGHRRPKLSQLKNKRSKTQKPAVDLSADRWLQKQPTNSAGHRLFCFPYAGGSAISYRRWHELFGDDIDVCPIQLPGRENRLDEPPVSNLKKLVQQLTTVLEPYVTSEPYAFFGHSMGALISFELAQEFKKRGWPAPSCLAVSAFRAPQLPDQSSPIHRLSDEKFIDALERYQGTPKSVLGNSDLMQIFLPILRADFKLLETYYYTKSAPLNCPIITFGGQDDQTVNQEKLSVWQAQTTSWFKLNMLPGDHFFFNQQAPTIVQSISDSIMAVV